MATHTDIATLISRQKAGQLLFPTDFRGKGSEDAIRKALSRLTIEGKIKRLAHGIYYKPKIDPVFGNIYPSGDQVAEMIAKKERVRIRPAGAYALNKLGLSTQVPTRLVYITDGVSRNLTIGKTTIRFKSTTSKKLSTKGKISSLLIQALEELDLEKMEAKTEQKIYELVKKEDARLLQHDLALAPARIHDYILNLLKRKTHDKLVNING